MVVRCRFDVGAMLVRCARDAWFDARSMIVRCVFDDGANRGRSWIVRAMLVWCVCGAMIAQSLFDVLSMIALCDARSRIVL